MELVTGEKVINRPGLKMIDKTILFGGNLFTMDSEGHRAEAVAIVGGKIDRVGTNADIRTSCGEGWKSIDLQGKTVLRD